MKKISRNCTDKTDDDLPSVKSVWYSSDPARKNKDQVHKVKKKISKKPANPKDPLLIVKPNERNIHNKGSVALSTLSKEATPPEVILVSTKSGTETTNINKVIQESTIEIDHEAAVETAVLSKEKLDQEEPIEDRQPENLCSDKTSDSEQQRQQEQEDKPESPANGQGSVKTSEGAKLALDILNANEDESIQSPGSCCSTQNESSKSLWSSLQSSTLIFPVLQKINMSCSPENEEETHSPKSIVEASQGVSEVTKTLPPELIKNERDSTLLDEPETLNDDISPKPGVSDVPSATLNQEYERKKSEGVPSSPVTFRVQSPESISCNDNGNDKEQQSPSPIIRKQESSDKNQIPEGEVAVLPSSEVTAEIDSQVYSEKTKSADDPTNPPNDEKPNGIILDPCTSFTSWFTTIEANAVLSQPDKEQKEQPYVSPSFDPGTGSTSVTADLEKQESSGIVGSIYKFTSMLNFPKSFFSSSKAKSGESSAEIDGNKMNEFSVAANRDESNGNAHQDNASSPAEAANNSKSGDGKEVDASVNKDQLPPQPEDLSAESPDCPIIHDTTSSVSPSKSNDASTMKSKKSKLNGNTLAPSSSGLSSWFKSKKQTKPLTHKKSKEQTNSASLSSTKNAEKAETMTIKKERTAVGNGKPNSSPAKTLNHDDTKSPAPLKKSLGSSSRAWKQSRSVTPKRSWQKAKLDAGNKPKASDAAKNIKKDDKINNDDNHNGDSEKTNNGKQEADGLMSTYPVKASDSVCESEKPVKLNLAQEDEQKEQEGLPLDLMHPSQTTDVDAPTSEKNSIDGTTKNPHEDKKGSTGSPFTSMFTVPLSFPAYNENWFSNPMNFGAAVGESSSTTTKGAMDVDASIKSTDGADPSFNEPRNKPSDSSELQYKTGQKEDGFEGENQP